MHIVATHDDLKCKEQYVYDVLADIAIAFDW